MTSSPIISAAGRVPDPAAASDSAAVTPDPADSAATDATLPGVTLSDASSAPASAADPVSAASGPGTSHDQPGASSAPASAADSASAASGPGTSQGQPTEPAPEASYPYSTTGSATAATGYAGATTEYGGSAADASGSITGYAGSDGSATDPGGYATDSGQTGGAGAAWPHQSFLELGALVTAAPCARMHTTLVLWEWRLDALVGTAGLVVSELVSNAVQASAGLTGSRFAGQWSPGRPPVRMWLSADDHRLVIQIWDGSDRPPVPQPVEPEAASGRGLLLVGALSAEWGCYTPEKSSGKVVWAVITG